MIPIEKTYTIHLPMERTGKCPVMTLVVCKGGAPDTYRIGVAICNPKDSFNKKLGRRIAFGRMQTASSLSVTWNKSLIINQINRVYGYRKQIPHFQLFNDLHAILESLEERLKNK